MMYAKWIQYLTGEMKVPYISEISDDAPEDVKREYWEYREKRKYLFEHPEKDYPKY